MPTTQDEMKGKADAYSFCLHIKRYTFVHSYLNHENLVTLGRPITKKALTHIHNIVRLLINIIILWSMRSGQNNGKLEGDKKMALDGIFTIWFYVSQHYLIRK